MDVAIIVAILFLALLGAPLVAVFAGAAMALFWQLEDTSITGAAQDIFSEKFAESPLLVTIPLFTFAGYLMAEAGTPKRLVRVSRAWFGWMPGGLAMVCLVASAFFTTFTGGSGITIVAIGGLLYPALISENYPDKFSLGLVTTGGSLGLLFPPSLPIVLLSFVAGVEVEKMFLAGLLPGVLTVATLAVYAGYIGAKTPNIPRQAWNREEAFAAFWEAKWELVLPIFFIMVLVVGVRIHEAAAMTAVYVLVIEVFIYKDVTLSKDLPRVIRESMTLVGAILAILATAIGFTGYLIQAQVPMEILEWIREIITADDPETQKIMFLLALNVFLLLVGMLMDIFSAIVVVVPLILPIARELGINDYHLGIVFLLNLEIGYMTPPVGLNLFISSFRFGKPVTVLYKAVLPYIGLLVIALGIVTYVPSLSLALLEEGAGDHPVAGQQPDTPVEEIQPTEPSGGGGGLDDLEDLLDGDDGELDLDALEGELDDGELDLDALEDELGDELGGDDGELDLDALEAELGDEELDDGLDGLEEEASAEEPAVDDSAPAEGTEGGGALEEEPPAPEGAE